MSKTDDPEEVDAAEAVKFHPVAFSSGWLRWAVSDRSAGQEGSEGGPTGVRDYPPDRALQFVLAALLALFG